MPHINALIFLTTTIIIRPPQRAQSQVSHDKYNDDKRRNHQLKSTNCRLINCLETPRKTAKDIRRNTQSWASHSRTWTCELKCWQIRERSASASGPKEPKVENPNGMKSKPWDIQELACLTHLPCSTDERAEAASLQPLQAGDTPTRSIHLWE